MTEQRQNLEIDWLQYRWQRDKHCSNTLQNHKRDTHLDDEKTFDVMHPVDLFLWLISHYWPRRQEIVHICCAIRTYICKKQYPNEKAPLTHKKDRIRKQSKKTNIFAPNYQDRVRQLSDVTQQKKKSNQTTHTQSHPEPQSPQRLLQINFSAKHPKTQVMSQN